VVLGYLTDNPGAEITNKLVRQLSGEDDMQKVKSALQRLRANGQIRPVDENVSAFNFRYVKV
jgi:ATP-dependent DNA helicase RecG